MSHVEAWQTKSGKWNYSIVSGESGLEEVVGTSLQGYETKQGVARGRLALLRVLQEAGPTQYISQEEHTARQARRSRYARKRRQR